MVIKMKETKIKYGILCSAVILAVIIGQSATAGVMRLEAKDNEIPNPSLSYTGTSYLGTAYCEQKPNVGIFAELNLYDGNEKDVALSHYNEDVKFILEYTFKLPGGGYDAQVSMWYWDDDGQHQAYLTRGEDDEGTLELVVPCTSGINFNLHVKARCTDWYGADHTEDEQIVRVKPELARYPKISGSGKITGTELRPMSKTKVDKNVVIENNGDPGSYLEWAWGYSEDRLYGDWDIFPGSGWLEYGEEQAISVEVTLPEEQKVSGFLRFYNVNDKTDYVDIPVSIGYKAKPATYSMQSLFEKAFGRYPNLLPLLRGVLNL